MDLSISPDVEAFYCYLIVLIIGVAVGKNRVSGLLTGFRGAWVLLDTWALLVVYSLLPVILFWLLDRSDALHDTSLFGAILVAVAYRQILAGGVQGVAAPGQITKAWQPLVDWTDRVAARIRDRIQRNTTRYDERVVSKLVQDKPKLEELTSLVQSYGTNPTDVENQLRTLATAFGALGPAGVLRKQASFLYQRLKVIPNLDFEYAMYQQGITSKFQYYWVCQGMAQQDTCAGGDHSDTIRGSMGVCLVEDAGKRSPILRLAAA